MWLVLVYGVEDEDLKKNLPKDFYLHTPGHLSYARFTTLCNSIIRLYAQKSKSQCSHLLRRLAIIMCMWYI